MHALSAGGRPKIAICITDEKGPLARSGGLGHVHKDKPVPGPLVGIKPEDLGGPVMRHRLKGL